MLCEGSLGVIAHLPRKTGDSLISPVCVSLSLRLSVFLPHYVSFLVSLSCSVCLSLCVSVLSPHFHLFFLSPSTMISLSVCLHLQLPDFLSLSLSLGACISFPPCLPLHFWVSVFLLCRSASPSVSLCLSVWLPLCFSVSPSLSLCTCFYFSICASPSFSLPLSSSSSLSLSVCVPTSTCPSGRRISCGRKSSISLLWALDAVSSAARSLAGCLGGTHAGNGWGTESFLWDSPVSTSPQPRAHSREGRDTGTRHLKGLLKLATHFTQYLAEIRAITVERNGLDQDGTGWPFQELTA